MANSNEGMDLPVGEVQPARGENQKADSLEITTNNICTVDFNKFNTGDGPHDNILSYANF